MEDRETALMRKYWESNTTPIMMATVPHVTSGWGQKISGRWIFVGQSVPLSSRIDKELISLHVGHDYLHKGSRTTHTYTGHRQYIPQGILDTSL